MARELQAVTRAAAKAASALKARDAAIRQAVAGGATLRAVAEAAGLSFARIHQIVNHR
jgi:2-keto-3-deoxy-L-rhamnonate aldolase RhmA